MIFFFYEANLEARSIPLLHFFKNDFFPTRLKWIYKYKGGGGVMVALAPMFIDVNPTGVRNKWKTHNSMDL